MLATILTIVFSAIAAIATVYLVGLEIKKRRKADLSIIVLSYGGGVQTIAIKNDGEADAKNISLTFPQSLGIKQEDDTLSTLSLSKGQQYNIYFHPVPREKHIQCVLQWDDKAGRHKKEQCVQILRF